MRMREIMRFNLTAENILNDQVWRKSDQPF